MFFQVMLKLVVTVVSIFMYREFVHHKSAYVHLASYEAISLIWPHSVHTRLSTAACMSKDCFNPSRVASITAA